MMWGWVLLAAAGAFATKYIGYLVPRRVLEHPLVQHISALMPVALLSAIVAVQGLTAGRSLVIDARVPGLLVAVLLLWRKANFLLVVVGAAATTAIVRALGWLA